MRVFCHVDVLWNRYFDSLNPVQVMNHSSSHPLRPGSITPALPANFPAHAWPYMVMWLSMVGDLYQRNAQLPHHGVQAREAHVSPQQLLPSCGRICTRTGRLLSLLPLSPLSTHLFSFGPQSAHAVGEVIHVYPICSSSSVVPTGRRGLGIFPLARVALARPLTCPGVSQWNIGLILRKGPKAKPWRLGPEHASFSAAARTAPGGRRPRAWASL